jgi:hypothetical protein
MEIVMQVQYSFKSATEETIDAALSTALGFIPADWQHYQLNLRKTPANIGECLAKRIASHYRLGRCKQIEPQEDGYRAVYANDTFLFRYTVIGQ